MMQSEFFQPSWSFCNNNMDSSIDQVGLYGLDMDDSHVGGDGGGWDFSSSAIFSAAPYFPSTISNDFVEFPDESPMEEIWEDMVVEFDDPNLSPEFESLYGGVLDESEGSFPSEQQLSINFGVDEWSPCPSMDSSNISMDITSIQQPSLILPTEDMEIDNQLSIQHLLEAYGEAMENEQRELAEVIVRCITEKVSPLGATMERLVYNLFQGEENQGNDDNYLKQESCKNMEKAFKTFYQIFPYGKFAHFAANSAILEALPTDTETIHIVDFDMGEGIQWPTMLEAIRRLKKAVRLTSIKWGEDDCCCAPQWKFEETKRRLSDHAKSIGLKLKVDEVEIDNLVNEIKRTKKRGGRRDWLAFNCMAALPHMGRARSRRDVNEFLRVAKELISDSENYITGRKGIITFGDGDAGEKLNKNFSGYGSFFDGQLAHYKALFESMERNFPNHLVEARMTMECLFLAPYVSCQAWLQKWEEMKEGSDNLQAVIELEGWKMSKDSLLEAKEMVKEGESSYGVKIEGQFGNEMVLEWRRTPLVKVSTWTD